MAIGDLLPRRWREPAYSGDLISPRFRRAFGDLMSDFFEPWDGSRMGAFMPKVNLRENDQQIEIEVELPGLKEDDVEVTVANEGILVRGEKREERRNGGDKGYYEFSYGSFERFIPVPMSVEPEDVEAQFERGVLRISVQKSERSKSQSRRIPIKGQASGEQSREGRSGKQSRKSENGAQSTAR